MCGGGGSKYANFATIPTMITAILVVQHNYDMHDNFNIV